ncbi:MAG: SDR family oxidoreductase [Bryobacteraceae bacterium]|nr:SDR family oxidoreductase [Bryobacteraceae bacterium]
MPEPANRQPDLSGRTCIVTGAARGLGAAIAGKLWACGASLLLVGRDLVRLEERLATLRRTEKAGRSGHAFAADLSDPGAAERIVAEARRVWPRLDGLVNNAAIQGPIGPLEDNNWAEWTRTIQVNLLAPVNLCRLAVPWMRAGGGGSVVSMSGGGATSPRPNFTAYATAKAALARFSETLARETEAFGVRVNCIAPGAMNTDMLREVIAAGAARVGKAEYERALRRDIEGGDPPEQAAELVAYLLSEDSRRISGRLISAVWDPWREFFKDGDPFEDADLYTLRRVTPDAKEGGR